MNATRTPSSAGRLAADALDVRYHKEEPLILQGLSLVVPRGKITGLIGANGSGKSTLLKTLGRQLTPSAGHVLLDGKAIASFHRLEMARSIGILFQENSAPHGLTVEELVSHGRFPYRRLFESETQEDMDAVNQALKRTGMTALRHHPLSQLSGGQKQLAWIALALAQTTQVFLLDEPTTFLDLKHQAEVMGVIESLRNELGLTIVMVLHDVNQAARHSDHLVALRDGRIIAQGSPNQVITPSRLREIYGIDSEVLAASDGYPVCVVRSVSPDRFDHFGHKEKP